MNENIIKEWNFGRGRCDKLRALMMEIFVLLLVHKKITLLHEFHQENMCQFNQCEVSWIKSR